jgi:hypothetical protein
MLAASSADGLPQATMHNPRRHTDTVVLVGIPRIVPVHVRLTIVTVPVELRDVVRGTIFLIACVRYITRGAPRSVFFISLMLRYTQLKYGGDYDCC